MWLLVVEVSPKMHEWSIEEGAGVMSRLSEDHRQLAHALSVRSVSVLCHDLGISCDGLFDLGLSWDVAEVVTHYKLWGA